MPYKDPEREKASMKERGQRYRAKKHAERFGPGAGDMRGRHHNGPKGSGHHRWNDALKTKQGYGLIRVGRNHPLACPNGYAKEALLVWVSAGNPAPKPNEVIHHRNGEITDNRIENIEVMTKGEHNVVHNLMRQRAKNGQFVGRARAGRTLDGEVHDGKA